MSVFFVPFLHVGGCKGLIIVIWPQRNLVERLKTHCWHRLVCDEKIGDGMVKVRSNRFNYIACK